MTIWILPEGGPWMDDQGQYGGALPGRGVRPAHQLTSQPSVHRPTRQNQVRLSHHHGGRKEVNTLLINIYMKTYMSIN